MARELKFASTNEALQHLANVTGKRVVVAEDKKDAFRDRWLQMRDELGNGALGMRLLKFTGYEFGDQPEALTFSTDTESGSEIGNGIIVIPNAFTDVDEETMHVEVLISGDMKDGFDVGKTSFDMTVAEMKSEMMKALKKGKDKLDALLS